MELTDFDLSEDKEIKDPYGFIYVITNMINGKRYIGQKKFDSGGRWKKYMGGGKHLKIAQEKYGIENFKRDIVHLTYSIYESNICEYNLIEFNNAVKSEDYYNLVNGGDVRNIIGSSIKVICVDDGKVYNSISDAEVAYDINGTYIKRSFMYTQCLTNKYSRFGNKLEIFREYSDMPIDMFICRVCATINKKDSANQKVCKPCSPFYYGNNQDKAFYDSMIKNRVMHWNQNIVNDYLYNKKKIKTIEPIKFCKKCGYPIFKNQKSKLCDKCIKENLSN